MILAQRLRQKAKRGARWQLQPIGEEIVVCNRHHRCSLKNRPVCRDIISEKGEELPRAQKTRGRKEARSWRAAAADCVHCGGVIWKTAAAAIGVLGDTTPTRPSEEQGSNLPRKKGTAVSWPRRGRRGMRRHNGASPYGGSRSRTAFLGYGSCNRPGAQGTGRFDG